MVRSRKWFPAWKALNSSRWLLGFAAVISRSSVMIKPVNWRSFFRRDVTIGFERLAGVFGSLDG